MTTGSCVCISRARARCTLPTAPLWYVDPAAFRAGPVALDIAPELAATIARAPAFSPAQAQRAQIAMHRVLRGTGIVGPAHDLAVHIDEREPQPVLRLSPSKADARAAVSFSRTATRLCRRAIRATRFALTMARARRYGPAIARSSAERRKGSDSLIFLHMGKTHGYNFSSGMRRNCATKVGGSKRCRRFRFASSRQATNGARKSTRAAPRNGSNSNLASTSTARASRSCRC